jgi:polysaccharide pyruvyl transferase WcaK-like protein
MIYGGGAQLNLKSELGLKNILKTIKIFKSKKNNKVCFFSIGIDGDYDKKVIKYILTEIVNFADYFSVRDNHSYEIIRSLNINKEVYLSSDPVVSYKILNECELNVTMEKMIDTIKIGIIPMGYKNLFLSLDRLINLLNEFNKNIEILITPFARGDTVSANNIIEYINNKYYGNKKLKIYKYNFTYNMDQIIMILTDVDYLITCRLHGGIIGALLYKPVLFCGNIEHLRYFHETLGFKNNNFIFDTKEIDNKIEYYIKYPANYICNHSCIEKAKNLLELDYDRLIKFLFYR